METAGARPLWSDVDGTPTSVVPRIFAGMCLALLAVAAVTLAGRRLAGALVNPPPSPLLLAVGAATVCAAVFTRAGWPVGVSRAGWIVRIAVSLAVITLFVALCLPGTRAACVTAIGVAFAAEESWAWFTAIRAGSRIGRQSCDTRQDVLENFEEDLSFSGTAPADEALALDASTAESVTQQLIRSRTVEDTEVLAGRLRAYFAPGQRTGSVHVAFCPPLDVVPAVEVEQIAGPQSRIKTAVVFAHGARFDVKLTTAASEATSVLLHFSAVASAGDQSG